MESGTEIKEYFSIYEQVKPVNENINLTFTPDSNATSYRYQIYKNDELVKEYNLFKKEIKGNVIFYVGLKRKEIPIKLLEADVFVCGSQKEEYPIMLCEAAVMKLPIITTKVGHASEIKGVCLIDNCEEMSEAMRRVYVNESERIERGEQVYKYALQHYRISDKVEWMQTKLEGLLKGEERK